MASALAIPHLRNCSSDGTSPSGMASSINGPILSTTVSRQGVENAVRNHYGYPPSTVCPPPSMVPIGGSCYTDGMEVVWHGEFSRLFGSFYPPHIWYLTITNQAPQQKWKFHRDSAKVRFCCQECGNGWTSMKGRVTFWFHLDHQTNAGFMQFKLYGQQCKKCNTGKFEYVMWYPEEVSKVVCNVYNKVGQIYYGFCQPPMRVDRRPGRPRQQHNADLCQACRDGECDQGRSGNSTINLNRLIHASLSAPPPEDTGNVKPMFLSTSSSFTETTAIVTEEPQANSTALVEVNQKSPPFSSSSENPPSSFASESPPSPSSSIGSSFVSTTSPETTQATRRQNELAKGTSKVLVTRNLSNCQSNFAISMPVGNSPFIYHPAPIQPMFTGMIPFHGQTIYPYFPPNPTYGTVLRPLPPTNVCSITELMSNTNINEKPNNLEVKPKTKVLNEVNNSGKNCVTSE